MLVACVVVFLIFIVIVSVLFSFFKTAFSFDLTEFCLDNGRIATAGWVVVKAEDDFVF